MIIQIDGKEEYEINDEKSIFTINKVLCFEDLFGHTEALDRGFAFKWFVIDGLGFTDVNLLLKERANLSAEELFNPKETVEKLRVPRATHPIEERNCECCVNHTDKGCKVWDCHFESAY